MCPQQPGTQFKVMFTAARHADRLQTAAATAAQLNEAVFTGNVERALFLLQGDLDVDAVKKAND